MTIKKRLFLSNILMIVVPAAIVAFVGLLCMALLWVTFQNGDSMRLEDREDLTRIGRDMADQIEGVMTDASDAWTSQMSSLESMTEDGTLRIVVMQNDGLAYVAGEEQPTDSQMVQAADIINETEAFISVGDRSVYRIDNTLSGGSWSLYLFGTRQEHLGSSLKVILALAAIGLIFIVFLTILMTNRFLTRFVVRRIEEPLDLLSDGARRLGDGDLDYRITYTGKDEFAPVCGAFNEMAARLKESVERTRRDEESRKELLAGISHDLRSPLTSIRAYVEGLLDGVAKTEEAKQRYLRTIHTKAEDIDRLVSQLFLYSKLDLEGAPMEIRPIRLDEFVSSFVEEAAPDSRIHGLEITAAQLAPVTVSADPEQLRRVLSNILENSIKYKDKETGRLCITLEENGRLVLADDGPGVPEDALPKLFDVFYRSDPARKNPAGGSGLGLAIAAKAVQGMGGAIRARNGPNGGLAIEITLRKGKPAMQKILIIEDDGDIATIERDYLELNDFQVEIAADGIAGLERGLHGAFDLILLDLMLPGMDGFSLCRRLREETDIPILMVTARREDIDKIRGLGLGADDYIEKPFSPSVLVARVRAHLARYERLTGGQRKAKPELRAGGLRMNTETRRVFADGQEVDLKNKEYELLQFLMLHMDIVFSREELYENIWGLEAMGDNATVAVHINRVREKIEPDPSHPRYIQTVWGAGYRFKGQ